MFISRTVYSSAIHWPEDRKYLECMFLEMRFCNIALRTHDFRARIFELKTRHITLVSETTTQMAVSVVRKGWKDLLFQSRSVHSIEPYITLITLVWSHFPLRVLRWRRVLLFRQKRQRNSMRNSCIYFSIKDVNSHPTSVFFTCCYPPSLLHSLVVISHGGHQKFALKCYLHGKCLAVCLKTAISMKLWTFLSIGFKLCCESMMVRYCPLHVCAHERERCGCPAGTWLDKILFSTQHYNATLLFGVKLKTSVVHGDL